MIELSTELLSVKPRKGETTIKLYTKEEVEEARRERDKEIAQFMNQIIVDKSLDNKTMQKISIRLMQLMGYDFHSWLLLLGDFLEPDKTWNDLKELSQ